MTWQQTCDIPVSQSIYSSGDQPPLDSSFTVVQPDVHLSDFDLPTCDISGLHSYLLQLASVHSNLITSSEVATHSTD